MSPAAAAPLVQELRLYHLVQPPAHGRLVPRRDGLQQVIGKLRQGGPVAPGPSPPPGGRAAPSASRAAWREWPAGAGARLALARLSLLEEPDSSTILVSSSTNSGTPSVLATTCSTISAGSALPCATRPISSAARRRGKRLSVTWVRCERPFQGGRKSGRQVNSARM